MMSNLLTKHYSVTENLLKALKVYIECKNYGIHGFFIKTAHSCLNELLLELYYLKVVQNYLDNQPYEIRGQMRDVYVPLDYRTEPREVVLALRDQAYKLYEEYASFPQSCCVEKVSYVLEQLND